MEYPRASKAVLVDAETGNQTELACGDTANALYYEMTDMEKAVKNRMHADKNDRQDEMHLAYTRDVMAIMTRLRKDWGMKYPGENWD